MGILGSPKWAAQQAERETPFHSCISVADLSDRLPRPREHRLGTHLSGGMDHMFQHSRIAYPGIHDRALVSSAFLVVCRSQFEIARDGS
jgi:hypothetical protein